MIQLLNTSPVAIGAHVPLVTNYFDTTRTNYFRYLPFPMGPEPICWMLIFISRRFKAALIFLTVTAPLSQLFAQELSPLNLDTLRVGKTLVIKYDALLNDTLPIDVTHISNQIKIQGANFSDIFTDDPGTETFADATVSRITVNSSPAITGVISDQLVNDNASIRPFASLSIIDADIPAQNLRVMVTVEHPDQGDFFDPVGFNNEGSGTYKFTGTASDATVAIRQLVFVPVANRRPPGFTERTNFTITVIDGKGGAITDNLTSVIITSIDDLTVLNGPPDVQHVDDSATIAPFSTVSVTDPDVQQLFSEITIHNGLNRGDFTPGSTEGWVRLFRDNDIVYFQYFSTTSNNCSLVQSAIRSLVFQPRANAIAPQVAEVVSFTIIVAPSPGSEIKPLEISVLTTSINDPPAITGSSAVSFTLPENSRSVTRVLANDPDFSAVLSFSIRERADGHSFQIDPDGYLSFVHPPNFEEPVDSNNDNCYELTVRVSDGTDFADQHITVFISNLNDIAPVISSGQSFSVDENSGKDVYVGLVAASDGDELRPVWNWRIVNGNTNQVFVINATTGELIVHTASELDAEVTGIYTLTISVSDGINISDEETVTIIINDRNDVAPVIPDNQVFSIDENAASGTLVGKVTALDGDVTATAFCNWSIVGSDLLDVFIIDSSTGELRVRNSLKLDYEQIKSFALALAVSDGVNTSSETKVRVVLKNLNDEVPVIVANQQFSINENALPGALVGEVVLTDADNLVQEPVYWTITAENPGRKFTIHPQTGMIIVAANLDFEKEPSYEIFLQVSDGHNLSIPTKVVIMIEDSPDSLIHLSFIQATLYENQGQGALAGTLISTAEDPDAEFTYSLVSGSGDSDNALFLLTGNEIRTRAGLNFEEKTTYSVRVRSVTEKASAVEKELLIQIRDVNDSPTLDPIADQTICQSTILQVIHLTGLSAGGDAGQEVSLSLSSTNEALFSQLLVAHEELRYRLKDIATGSVKITVRVNDNGDNANGGVSTIERTFTITITSAPEVTITSDQGVAFAKGLQSRLTAAGGVSFQWEDADGIISGRKTSTLVVRPSHNTTYRVKAFNENGCSTEQTITITVIDNYSIVRANNILSPNGDGVNDRLIIENLDMYPNNEVKIFDRAGRMLYSKRNYTNDWNGTFRGALLAEDTYFYVVDFGPGINPVKGFITIIHN